MKKIISRINFFSLPTVTTSILAFIASLSVLPNNEILAHGPFFPWPPPDRLFSLFTYHLSTWVTGPHRDHASALYYLYIGIVNLLTPSTFVAQRFIFFLSFLFIGISAHHAAKKLKLLPISALIASIFYLVTPAVFTGMPIEIVNIHLSLFYISSPLLLASLIEIHENENNFFKNFGWRA